MEERIEEGIQKGIKDGKKETNVETAKKLLSLSVNIIEQIAQVKELSIEKIAVNSSDIKGKRITFKFLSKN